MSRRTVRSFVLALAGAALAFVPHAASAQDLPRPPRAIQAAEPDYWVGLSYGVLNGVTLTDGATGSTWDFGYSPQLRATVEKRLQRGLTAGLSASFATAPLTYVAQRSGSGCPSVCEANADIAQYLVFIRGGTGLGFHGIYNLEAGVTNFSKFREQTTNATLAPTSSSYDFTFGLGGGLGYGINRTTDVYVEEQTDLVLHSQGSGQNSGNGPRMLSLVGGVRIGF